jgi:hypothetical protein
MPNHGGGKDGSHDRAGSGEIEGVRVSTARERAEQKRREKLALIRQQLQSGALTIRQMTPAERAKYPPCPRPARRGSGRSRYGQTRTVAR